MECEELTGGNFVAESQEGILVRRIAPPSVQVAGYLRRHLKAVCGKAGGGHSGQRGTTRPARDLSWGMRMVVEGLEETGNATTISNARGGDETKKKKGE